MSSALSYGERRILMLLFGSVPRPGRRREPRGEEFTHTQADLVIQRDLNAFIKCSVTRACIPRQRSGERDRSRVGRRAPRRLSKRECHISGLSRTSQHRSARSIIKRRIKIKINCETLRQVSRAGVRVTETNPRARRERRNRSIARWQRKGAHA